MCCSTRTAATSPTIFSFFIRTRCVPKYRVCLSDSSDCLQYECVGRPAPCDKINVEPVCDTNGLVHLSLCHLQRAGKTLAYMGHCQVRWAGPRGISKKRGFWLGSLLCKSEPVLVVSPGRLQETSAGVQPQRRDLQHGVRRLL